MRTTMLLTVAAAAMIAAAPAAAQNDAAATNNTATTTTTTTTDVNATEVNGATPDMNAGAPVAPPAEETTANTSTSTGYAEGTGEKSHFPWGVLGILGLVGLLGRRRR
jgi:MYXO-CTERM domain-containing protein